MSDYVEPAQPGYFTDKVLNYYEDLFYRRRSLSRAHRVDQSARNTRVPVPTRVRRRGLSTATGRAVEDTPELAAGS